MTAALGAGLLAVPLAPHAPATVDEPWAGDCQAAWCGKESARAHRDGWTDGLERAAARARAVAGRDCREPAAWPPGRLPAAMVVERAGRVEVMPWAWPAPPGAWVLDLCAR